MAQIEEVSLRFYNLVSKYKELECHCKSLFDKVVEQYVTEGLIKNEDLEDFNISCFSTSTERPNDFYKQNEDEYCIQHIDGEDSFHGVYLHEVSEMDGTFIMYDYFG